MTGEREQMTKDTPLDRKILNRVRRIVGKSNCSDRREDLFLFAYDGMNRRYLPDMVVHPKNAEEVSAIMVLANENLFPVVPRGAGSGLTGGSLAVDGGLVVTTQRMNQILEVDEDDMTVWVQSGVLNVDLQTEVEKRGLFFSALFE